MNISSSQKGLNLGMSRNGSKINNSKSFGGPIIDMRGICKYFGHIVALEDVNFSVYQNEILALVGDNGAGKSTLIKILSGVLTQDKGGIYFEDKPVSIRNSRESKALGIGTVYQDLALVDCLDVATNLFLGKEPVKMKFFVRRDEMNKESLKIIDKLKIKIKSPNLITGFLSGGQRQALAIGRVILENCKVFLLDEPTAALGVRESNEVINLVRDLKRAGATIVIISHQLEEVFSLVDRIFVLRQGKVVGSRSVSETTKEEIIGMITGVISN